VFTTNAPLEEKPPSLFLTASSISSARLALKSTFFGPLMPIWIVLQSILEVSPLIPFNFYFLRYRRIVSSAGFP
jgi:hypothetical protein